MTKLRISYTLLNLWKSDWQKATEYYFKLKSFTSPAMADGKKWHEQFSKEVEKSRHLPAIFGAKELNNPKCEIKLVYNLADWCDLVGVIDVIDDECIYDYKIGKTPSEDYVNGYQLGMYGLLAKANKMQVNKGVFLHYDHLKNKTDQSIVWLDKEYLSKTLDWIEGLGSEIHNYFESNDLYRRYGKEDK